MEIGGLEWMGLVHGGIIVDTLPRVLDHSSLPLRIHLGGMLSGIGTRTLTSRVANWPPKLISIFFPWGQEGP